jgi:FkbM family methyltransferase
MVNVPSRVQTRSRPRDAGGGFVGDSQITVQEHVIGAGWSQTDVPAIDGNGRLICYFGDKFDNIHEFLKIFLREGMVFVDAGANIGSHTINAASLFGRTGSVFAFEADPETYHLLLENIERNKLNNVTVRQTCVADNIGVVSFFKHKDSAKSSIVDRGEKVAVTLPADKLDNLIPADVGIDKSAGIRELLEGYGYEFYSYEGQKLTKLTGIALNAFAIHRSALTRVLQQFRHD